MKFLVIGDMHIGVAKDDPWQEMIREKTMEKVISHAVENNIKNLVFMGDVFDDRTSLTHRSLEFNRKYIIEPIEKHDLHAIMIIGNHDAMHKNTLTPNAIEEVFGNRENFTVVDSIKTIEMGNTKVDFVSWMCTDNTYEITSYIEKSEAKYCFGHFELVGFYYYSGIKATKGVDPQFLQKYNKVYSGHYHTINGHGNTFYLGTPFTITSNDVNEERGIWEFDSNNMDNPTFIPNEKIWHRRFSYPMDVDIETFDLDIEEFRGTRVVIDLNDKEDKDFLKIEEKLEKIVDRLEIKNNYAINNALNTSEKMDAEIKASGGPLELGLERLDKDESLSDLDKSEVKKIFTDLYLLSMSTMGDE